MSERSKRLVTLALNQELAQKICAFRATKTKTVNEKKDNVADDPDFIPKISRTSSKHAASAQIKPKHGMNTCDVINNMNIINKINVI